mgnify:CR=1 FL=1
MYSISVFFPCYNDAGTIGSMVILAFEVLSEISEDYEVIVVDDGSTDASRDILKELKIRYKDRFRVIEHEKNMGYGGALRTGFKNAAKELIFYTDGDAQYDVRELKKLLALMGDDTDVVNGFKTKRSDPYYRVLIGKIYHNLMKSMFNLKIRDVDCDFRLMRKRIFEKINLEYASGVICVEMVKKIQDAGFRFREVGVTHYFRAYGKSQFFNFKRIIDVGAHILILWWKLVVIKRSKGRRSPQK